MSISCKKLVVGLGNPGLKYKNTPHNLGFEVMNSLAKEDHAGWSERNFAQLAETQIENCRLVLVKPRTYMNLSGQAVKFVMDEFELSMEDLIVVCDDMALPLGKIRIRGRGSAGGHNGLKSIIECLSRNDFVRIRLGVAPESKPEDMADYVLTPFPGSLRDTAEQLARQGKEAVKMVCSLGLHRAMDHFN